MYFYSSSRMDGVIWRSLFCTAKTNCIRIWVYELAMLLQTGRPSGAGGIIFNVGDTGFLQTPQLLNGEALTQTESYPLSHQQPWLACSATEGPAVLQAGFDGPLFYAGFQPAGGRKAGQRPPSGPGCFAV